MAYEVTATRKRPHTFDELVGQEFVVTTLKNSIEQGRTAHAYLFSGPRGVGKTSAARIVAKALNCDSGPTPMPCGECPACREIARGNALDVIEIDGASNTSVNDVREIKDEVLFAPNSSRYKIYIIDEVHMLSNSAFNALLKTIEEPPPYIVFIFATTEIHKVPATIRSRCQQFNFRLIPMDRIVELLREVVGEAGAEADEDALLWIAKESTGSARDAYTLFDQVLSFSQGHITLKLIRDKLGILDSEQMNALVLAASEGNAEMVLEQTDEILRSGIALEQFVIDMAEYFRTLLLVRHGIRKHHLLGCAAEAFPQKLVEAFEPAQIEKGVDLFLELYRNLKYSLNPGFELELVMSRLAELKHYIPPGEIVRRLEALEGGETPPAPLKPSPARSADSPQSGKPAGEVAHNPEQLLDALQQASKREKPLLASALDRVARWGISPGEVSMEFGAGETFLAEMVQGERELLCRLASEALGREVKVSISVARLPGDDSRQDKDERVEMVKRVFRGEIVEGEG